MDINRALARKIWLRCGGYIIIEATEALTVIDVNTGRYVGKTDLEETIFLGKDGNPLLGSEASPSEEREAEVG